MSLCRYAKRNGIGPRVRSRLQTRADCTEPARMLTSRIRCCDRGRTTTNGCQDRLGTSMRSAPCTGTIETESPSKTRIRIRSRRDFMEWIETLRSSQKTVDDDNLMLTAPRSVSTIMPDLISIIVKFTKFSGRCLAMSRRIGTARSRSIGDQEAMVAMIRKIDQRHACDCHRRRGGWPIRRVGRK